jgi:hypothetical protein
MDRNTGSLPIGVFSIASLTHVVQYYVAQVYREYISTHFGRRQPLHWPAHPPTMIITDRILTQIETYLDAGADPDVICDLTGARVFAMAIVLNCRPLSRLLAEHGASWTIKDQFGPLSHPTFPIFFLLQTNPIHLHDLLPLSPINVWRQLTPQDESPLHVAFDRDHSAMRSQHLTKMTQNDSMAFALVLHLDTLQDFWEHHVIDAPDADGNTVLMKFCGRPYAVMCFRIMFAFLERGHPDWNLQNKAGESALHAACQNSLLAVDAAFSRPNMQFHLRNNIGFTPFLSLLILQRYTRCIELIQRDQQRASSELIPILLEHTEWGSYLELIGYRSKNSEYEEIVRWMLLQYIRHGEPQFIHHLISHVIKRRMWKVLMIFLQDYPSHVSDVHRANLAVHLHQGRCKFDDCEFNVISRFMSS